MKYKKITIFGLLITILVFGIIGISNLLNKDNEIKKDYTFDDSDQNLVALSSFSSSIKVENHTGWLTSKNDGSVYGTISSCSTASYPCFRHKKSNLGDIICASGLKTNAPGTGVTCNIYNNIQFLSDKQAKGVAYIINKISGTDGGAASLSNIKYYWIEVLVLDYLNRYTPGSNSYMKKNIIDGNVHIADTNMTYNQILTEATNYAAKNFETTLNVSGTSMSFSLCDNNQNYCSDLTITSSTDYTITFDNKNFSYDKNSRKIKIPVSKVKVGGTEKFTATIKNTGNKYYTSKSYECGTGVQKVILTQTQEHTTASKSVTVTGSVTRNGGTVKVAKKDKNGNFIAGAKLGFQSKADYDAKRQPTQVTSTNNYVQVNGTFPEGTYCLFELEAPSGYDKSKDVICKDINNSNTSITIDVTNNLTKTVISKKDVTGQKELPGATLEVQDSKGTVVKYCGENRSKECKWVSTEQPYVIEGLPKGKYYLVETIAPDGYVLNKEKVSFEVKGDGTVTNVVMNNSLNKLEIYKLDETGKKSLPGAYFQIEDKKGNVVKYCKDETGANVECKWVSTEKPYVIEGFPKGKYYLVETKAPDGYVLNKEKVEFEVKSGVPLIKVEMENKLNKLRVNKYDTTGKRLLAGAHLQIEDEEGNVVKYCKDEEGKNIECKWVTTEDPYEIEGFPFGIYYLVETEAPIGYILSKEKKAFEVTEENELIEIEMANTLEVKVPDTLSSKSALLLAIAMFDIALGIGIIIYVKRNKIQE